MQRLIWGRVLCLELFNIFFNFHVLITNKFLAIEVVYNVGQGSILPIIMIKIIICN